MRRTLILFKKECLSQFMAPSSWGLLTLVWLLHGILFRWTILSDPGVGGDILFLTWKGSLQAHWLQLLIVPLQTMRLVSEEKRSGTFEMLVTTPARDHEIILAKFLGAWTFNALIWIVIPIYALIMMKSGGDPPLGPVAVSYLAVVATGALYISIGLFASSLTAHQILAAFLTIVMLVLVGVLPMSWAWVPESWPNLRAAIRTADLGLQVEEGARGLLDLVHLTYKLAFCGLFLVFATRSLEVRKWI